MEGYGYAEDNILRSFSKKYAQEAYAVNLLIFLDFKIVHNLKTCFGEIHTNMKKNISIHTRVALTLAQLGSL